MNAKNSLGKYIQEMPKAEIHIHLEGSIQPQTVLTLAERNNMLDTLPSHDVEGLAKWFTFKDFKHFIKVYLTIQDLLRTPDDFSLIVYECGADMAAQNIRYREVTVTPHTHIEYLDKGLKMGDIMDGLEDGRRRAKEDFGVEIRWVFDIARNLCFPNGGGKYDPRPAQQTLKYAVAGRKRGVVGLGLGGHEVGAPPEHFAPAFKKAKRAGLLSVPHAGETVGPESVWGSVNDLKADRIGHGVRAIEDPALLEVLINRQIPLEINPSSNICLHVYPSMEAHPFRKLDEMGILVTVNSDDPPLFNTNLSEEYNHLAQTFGYGKSDLARIARNAFAASGLEPSAKSRLLSEFDTWVANHPG